MVHWRRRLLARTLTLLAWLSAPWSGLTIGNQGLRPTDALLIAALVAAAATTPARRGTYRHPLAVRYLAGLGLIVLGALIGAIAAVDFGGVHVVLRAALVALPLLVLLRLRADRSLLRHCAAAFVIGTLALVVVGAVNGLAPNSGRLRGWSVHPNQVAMTCVMSIAFVGVLAPSLKPGLRRAVQAGIVAVLLFGISASGSRSGLVALFVVGGVLGLRWLRSHPSRLASAAGAVAAVVVVVGLVSYDPANSSALRRLMGDDTTVSLSNRERQDLYDDTLAEVSVQRVIFGGKQFEAVDRPHSILLEVTLGNGLTGLAGLLLLFLPPLYWLRRRPDALTAAASLAILGYIVNVAINNALWSRFAWCVLALAYVARINERTAATDARTSDEVPRSLSGVDVATRRGWTARGHRESHAHS